jgi:hypothetical protein
MEMSEEVYSNPNCVNKDQGDCSKGHVIDGLCEKCSRKCSSSSYRKSTVDSDWNSTSWWLKVLMWLGMITNFLILATILLGFVAAVIYGLLKLLG